MRHWAWLVPVAALALLFVALSVGVGTLLAALRGAALIGAVLVTVHHAEVVAHRVGEPLGTLVLALAVTRPSGRAYDGSPRRERRTDPQRPIPKSTVGRATRSPQCALALCCGMRAVR